MKKDFFHQQPHPETNETACTWLAEDAVPLRSVDDRSAVCCAGTTCHGECVLAVVFSENPKKIEWFVGETPFSCSRKSILMMQNPVKQLSLSVVKNELYLGVHTESILCLLKGFDGRLTAQITTCSKSAAICFVKDEWFLVEDRTITKLDDKWRLSEASVISAADTSADRYPLPRKDALELESRNLPGTMGGMLFSFQNDLYYACADVFYRCGTPHTDTFLCRLSEWNKPFLRRYLAIPCGGAASFFSDESGKLYAAIIGQEDSTVCGKAAVVPMVFSQDYEFLHPSGSLVTEKAVTASMRPVSMYHRIRDSFVYSAPDGWYYITGTTQNSESYWRGTSAIRLWKTKDFSEFEDLGRVYDYAKADDAWQMHISHVHNAWAPEIIYYNETFWITYSLAPGCGLLKSVTGKPEGPYQDMGRVVMRGIDSGFFLEGETLYLIWQNGMIAPFNRECTSFAKEPVLLLPQDGQEVGYEGAGLIYVEGKYVLYAAEWNGDLRIDGTYDMMYSTADHLTGPYSPRRILVPHGGHGSLFRDHEGKLCFSMFGNDRTASFRHSVGIGRIRITHDKDGELILTPESLTESRD